jgi:uncharacterized protein (TIGR02145 family)
MKKNFRTLLNFLLIAGVIMIFASSCKKDSDTNDATVKDIDGNSYTSVTIGTQVWMVENLKTTKYRNGDPIPNVSDNIQWSNITSGAHCNYNNEAVNGNKYGRLYNWHAVNDSRNIAPTGWHVPTDAEWTTLEDYLNDNTTKYGSLEKSLAAKTDWAISTNANAPGNDLLKNNSTGFTALPGGKRRDGTFDRLGSSGGWWSSSRATGSNTYISIRAIIAENAWGTIEGDGYMVDGFSVRCIKD